jgi:hypothetical protein
MSILCWPVIERTSRNVGDPKNIGEVLRQETPDTQAGDSEGSPVPHGSEGCQPNFSRLIRIHLQVLPSKWTNPPEIALPLKHESGTLNRLPDQEKSEGPAHWIPSTFGQPWVQSSIEKTDQSPAGAGGLNFG